jgi:ATP-binding cassette subfamily B protein
MRNYKLLFSYINKDKRKTLKLVILLMFISSVTEIISIGSIIPFLSVLIEPEILNKNKFIENIIKEAKIEKIETLKFIITSIFVVVTVISGIMKILLLYLLPIV